MKTRGLLILSSLAMAVSLSFAQSGKVDPQTKQEFLKRLVAAAEERSHHAVRYDPAYVRIPYPGGDVPGDTGFARMK